MSFSLPSLFVLAGLAYSTNAQFVDDNRNNTSTTQRIIAGVVVAVLALIACVLCSIGLSRRRRRRLLVVPQGQYPPQGAGGPKPPFFGSGWGWHQQYPPNQNQTPYIPPQGSPYPSTSYHGGGYNTGAEQRPEYPPYPPPYKREDTKFQPPAGPPPGHPESSAQAQYNPGQGYDGASAHVKNPNAFASLGFGRQLMQAEAGVYGYNWPGVLQRTRRLGWDYWEWRMEVGTTVCVWAIATEKVPAERVYEGIVDEESHPFIPIQLKLEGPEARSVAQFTIAQHASGDNGQADEIANQVEKEDLRHQDQPALNEVVAQRFKLMVDILKRHKTNA
ncbi:hypothetical protein F5146DRAFT_998942 [Armillaria mellea]|nr:hypothetical protein F5146DRAFT_998942 [Armillaria mellea]